ncbi:response regulator [Actinoplanes sp. L3-i22]|uniref:response regulator n=1 Tax=Actinoplanes sp. L3-i22 TaxID=2836373 RepID=UPI00351D5028
MAVGVSVGGVREAAAQVGGVREAAAPVGGARKAAAPVGGAREAAAPVSGARVLIVDDDPLVRDALRTILHDPPTTVVVGEAADGTEVAAQVDLHQPDVVLMDIRMPKMDGLAATELLRCRPDPPEVIVLTAFHVDDYVLRALRAGAIGFLLKGTPAADILRAVNRVAAGESFVSPMVLRELLKQFDDSGAAGRRVRARRMLGSLSERERSVAAAMATGGSNADIGRELFLSMPTVKQHVSSILLKLKLNSRTQIALLAHDADLTG